MLRSFEDRIKAATRHSPWQSRALIAVLTIAIGGASIASINGAAVVKDAAQELQVAINISHHGVMSEEEHPPLEPSMYREPLPIVLEAAAVGVADLFLGRADAPEYFSGKRTIIIKCQNVIFLLLLWSAALVAARWFTSSYLLATVAGLLAIRPFLTAEPGGIGINALNTELLAALLLLLASFGLAVALASRRPWRMAIAGGCFGLLALTKASALYAFAGVVLILLIASICRIPQLRARVSHILVLGACFVIVVIPWIGRNIYEFGAAEISLRGGLAIYTRALMDGISRDEYWGSYYVWAGPRLQPYVGRVLGFRPGDLNYGGKLQRLNFDLNSDLYDRDLAAERAGRPDDAITYYRRARAERIRLQRQYTQRGDRHPELTADDTMKSEGLRMIRYNVLGNLEMTVPLVWRSGHWYLIALAVAFGYGFFMKRGRLIAFVLPGLSLLGFYALATPFEPRWTSVVDSVAVIVTLTIIQQLWSGLDVFGAEDHESAGNEIKKSSGDDA
ncbi:MAG: hypothetical protein M3N91_11020 [Pseudomonadota bacterium]|nr:hypothetical protein [Pseudomonadota bacterium]